ncbi:MAG: hypothetical protein VB876_05570 [Pirellulales bacterium]
MQTRSFVNLLLPFTTVVFLLANQDVHGQPSANNRDGRSKIGGIDVATVLQRLGAKMEQGATLRQLNDYSRHFSLVDRNRDGRHSKVEFIDNGNYLTPRARRGIFNAADNDSDGFVTKAEYVLNRVITDEAKRIVQAMDDDKDGTVQRTEFVNNALKDAELAKQVFAALDTDENGAIPIPEYLRVWGQWARTGRRTPEQRISARTSELGKTERPATRDRQPINASRPGLANLLLFYDTNGNRKIEPDELLELIRRADRNNDRALDREELEAIGGRTRPPTQNGDRAPQQPRRPPAPK